MVITQNFDLDIDTTLGGSNASDYVIPSQKAIKDYVDNHSGSGSITIDNETITKNTSGELQSVAVIDSNEGETLKTWTGTKAEYDAITPKDPNTLYYIIDDNTASAYEAYTKSEVASLLQAQQSLLQAQQETFQNELYYKPGDSYSFVNELNNTARAINVMATLTNAAKMIVFSLFLPKSLNNISNITINSLRTNIRANNTYIPGTYTQGGIDAFTFSNVIVHKIKDNIVNIYLDLNTAANVTNNIPVSVEINAITLSFS